MKSQIIKAAGLVFVGLFLMHSQSAFASESNIQCGLNNGKKAEGEPIILGGINGNAPPGDFSGGTDGAAAYFKCVNENGGINGRPIEYLVENDQWNPELAAQVATKLVKDKKAVALVGNGSVVSMAVNAKLYEEENIMAMASGCAISECYESANIVSTNQGPLPSGAGALKYAVEELGAEHAACIGFNIPNNGGWACDWMSKYMNEKGKKSTAILMDPSSVDLNSVYLQAVASGADTILLMIPAGPAIGLLKVAEEQDGGDEFKWVAPTPLYAPTSASALGSYWSGKVFVNIELAPYDSKGADNLSWVAVMDKYGNKDDQRDTFSQSGYLSAKYLTNALLKMDPKSIDRANVTKAIKAINGEKSDLMCGSYYVGDFKRHMPNHAGRMMVFKDDNFEMVRDCYDIDISYLEEIRKHEKQLGLTN